MFSTTPRLVVAVLLALAVPSVSVVALAQTAATPAAQNKVATVNGVVIPKSRVDMIVRMQVAQGQPDSSEMREAIKQELVKREVVTQEANKRGLAKQPEVAAQLELARQNVLFNAYAADFAKRNQISDAEIQSQYEKIKGQIGDKEYKSRHILVETEAQANDLIARLKKGEKFEDLAKQNSKDPGSKDKGGELDWNSAAAYAKPFGTALSKLEKGQTTETPVQTQFGWHIIQVEDSRAAQFPPLEQVRPQLTQRLQAQAIERHFAELRGKAKVE